MLEINFTMKPMTPIMLMPITPVFMYVHTSPRLGLPTSLISLLHEERNDLTPTFTLPTNQHSTSMYNPSFNFTVVKRLCPPPTFILVVTSLLFPWVFIPCSHIVDTSIIYFVVSTFRLSLAESNQLQTVRIGRGDIFEGRSCLL